MTHLIQDRPRDALARLCGDLRRLREQAGGPSVRALAVQVGLGKSQVAAILAGRIRRPPDWSVVRGLVDACYGFARQHGRWSELSITGGLAEYWRPRHALLEHACHDQSAGAAAASASVPRQLPPVVPDVVGRDRELAVLSAAAGPGAGPLLVTGTAGVGKTTLALAWAAQAADRYPDGQLYVRLRGFEPDRPALTPPQAVRILLAGLGVPARDLPSGFDAQVGRYRSLVAGLRILVVLDDARDAGQVRPLLPAPPAQAVVTSRNELAGLVASDGGHPLALAPLPEPQARLLLAARLGRRRLDAEPDAVARLLAAGGGLPIALAALAARAATRPDFLLAAIADDAARVLRGGGPAAIGTPAVWPVFAGSYRALGAPTARLFRLLAVHPGPAVGVPAAASLGGVTPAQAGASLAELAGASMISEYRPGRYRLHDLWRDYARDLADPQLGLARLRCLDHYLHTAVAAAALFLPGRVPIGLDRPAAGVLVEPLADRDCAQAWFAAERAILLDLVGLAAAGGFDAHAWRLAWAVADFLDFGGYYDDWQAVQRVAVSAARRLGDPEPLGRMLLILGNARLRAGRPEQASAPLREALELFGAAGLDYWQARTEHLMGEILERQGRYPDALGCARRSLVLFRTAGSAEGVARAHNAIGWCLAGMGRYGPAVRPCERALAWYREAGDRLGLAATLDSLGTVYRGLGRYGDALDCQREALAIARERGDRPNQAVCWENLGETHAAAGHPATTRAAWVEALSIYTELGHPRATELRARLAGLVPPEDSGGTNPLVRAVPR